MWALPQVGRDWDNPHGPILALGGTSSGIVAVPWRTRALQQCSDNAQMEHQRGNAISQPIRHVHSRDSDREPIVISALPNYPEWFRRVSLVNYPDENATRMGEH